MGAETYRFLLRTEVPWCDRVSRGLDCGFGAGTLRSVGFERFVPALALAAIFAVPRSAGAVDTRVRTPAQFGDVACIEVVDRSQEPVFHLSYTVLADDTDRQDDEVADGRTHQFFAFRRQYTELPRWITRADVEAAMAAGRVDDVPTDASNVLDESLAWASDDWFRITPDDARLPITMAQAAMGVDWDTSSLPEGAYVLAGYTWDPSQSLWSTRWGVIKVVDGDPADGPPAVRLDQGGDTLSIGSTHALGMCVDAQPGTVARASWGRVVGDQEPTWHAFAEDLPVETETTEIPFCVPADVLEEGSTGATIRFRVEVTDPSGRTYVALTPTPYNVIGRPEDDACTPSGGDGDGDGDSGGGGCRLDSASNPGRFEPWRGALILVVLLGLRRTGAGRGSLRCRRDADRRAAC